MNSTTNMKDTIRELIADLTLLLRQEISLARAEAGEKIDQIQNGFIALVAGLLIAFCALLVLVQALVVALANIMPASVASLAVGIVLAVIAYISVTSGSRQLKPENLAPRRTMKSVRESAERMKEAS
ncbi:MAG: phage holin family protein [Rhizobiaceae bacterium]|nr:phage holin family protein [Rhizobiaceae bacterium]